MLIAPNSEFPYVKCNYISLKYDTCIQMVSNDCKKLLEVYLYINKPIVVGNCRYKGKQK